MSEKVLTKIFCPPAESLFVVLYIRQKELKKEDLNLVPWNQSFKICDIRIRTNLLREFQEYKELSISMSDYFNMNLVVGQCKRRSNEFTLRKLKVFDEEKEVINWYQILSNLEPIYL